MSHDDHDHAHVLSPSEQRLEDAARDGCEESRLLLSRRSMMGLSAGLFSWAFMPKVANASGTETRLLFVILRGGMDGLHVAIPRTEYDTYAGFRGALANTRAEFQTLQVDRVVNQRTVTGDSGYLINRSMPNLAAMFRARQASIVVGIAPPLRSRSHFQCLQNLENGLPDRVLGVQDGWLNRLLARLPETNPVKARGAIQVGRAPLILRGNASVLAWSPAAINGLGALVNQPLLDRYGGIRRNPANPDQPDLRRMLSDGIALQQRAGDPTGNPVQRAFQAAGTFMKSADGPRIAVLNVDAWDTHSNQKAAISERLATLDQGLQMFRGTLGEVAWANTAVVCVSEFGRTARLNGSGGTDHGTGTHAFLCGGAVSGGQILGQWVGLNSLFENRDLAAEWDTRQLFKGIMAEHLGIGRAELDSVFPETSTLTSMSGLVNSPSTGVGTVSAFTLARLQSAPPLRARSPIGRYRQVHGAG